MNAREFFNKVAEMRRAQKAFEKQKDSLSDRWRKKLEREIDNEIGRVTGPEQPTQKNIF